MSAGGHGITNILPSWLALIWMVYMLIGGQGSTGSRLAIPPLLTFFSW
jgi:hypothetical protein